MTKILYAIAILIVSSATGSMGQHRVEVIITDIRDTTGVIMVGFFSDADSFLKKPLFGVNARPNKGEIRVVFDKVEPGPYAVSIIHDSNRNGKLDSNFLGVPKEGFGFSNYVIGSFGPPSFEKATVNVNTTTQVSIRLRYM